MGDCLFCQIANRGKNSDVVYEDDKFFAFKDINPAARVHILIIPRKHIDSINHLETGDIALIGELFLTAKKLASQLGVAEQGYKLQINVGRGGGQLIDHLHVHLMAD